MAAPDAAALPNKQGRILDGLQATHDDTKNTTDLGKEDKRVKPHLGDDLGEEVVGDNDDKPFPFGVSTIIFTHWVGDNFFRGIANCVPRVRMGG